ncbi:substrate-binding domain-containing protein [Saccharopolyspora sp. ASAGF58]|uniref:substrate-binding domain-containing protein n=1 Tax=Saccharopolyspora sp. ASAGF58 TaxID=2719023 RepID=UPI0014400743|nr:substrate-binding domain-containing protein [Saccharopolyspora sp. ASAGF58]QIZ37073.1 substrate-binding domain-containing protein [Saccharopolyspora sp. ASAGF58]
MTRTRIAAVCGALLALTLSACGSASSDGPTGTTSDDVIEQAKASTEQAFAGTDRALPSDGPKAQQGKTVWALACSTQAAGCVVPAEGFVEASKALGWQVKLVDGKADPAVYNSQLRAAAAANVDAVALFGVDCSVVKASIEEVQAAGVLVYGGNALGCDDRFSDGGKPLFNEHLRFNKDLVSYEDYMSEFVGPTISDWVIAKTDGTAKVILMRQDDNATLRMVGDAQAARLAECDGCVVHEVTFTAGDLFGGQMQAKASAALQQFPNANVVMVPADSAITLGVGAAVDQARQGGREDLLLTGNEGVESSIALIRSGTQSYAVGRPLEWTGWAAADGLNRLFVGAEPVDSGMGIGSMDADHLPEGDVYDGNPKSSGYQENYKKIWGVG